MCAATTNNPSTRNAKSERDTDSADAPPRLVLVTCSVLDAEIRGMLSSCPNIVDIRWMEQGLHNEPDKLREQVQATVNAIEHDRTDIDAIVLGYGICSRGLEGVHTRRCKLVIPRAHDCITLLLGSKERYAQYVANHPGTYWYSPGWNKYHTPPGPERYQQRYDEYVQKYGEENAEFLMETEQHWFSTYDRATYVHLTIGVTDQDLQYTRDCADWLKWQYDEVQGDPKLLHDLLAGRWDDERFLVLEPGMTPTLSNDEKVLKAKKVET